MGLQSGELDAVYGLPYASYPLFENDNYNINSAATSRAFFLQLNFDNDLFQDKNINDGYVDKDGKNFEINFLTYPGRSELPVLAQSIQSNLKDIGIKVNINSTENYLEVMKDSKAWDILASAMVTNPTGNKAYFFDMTSLSDSPKNRGHYSNAELDELAETLSTTFDSAKRDELAEQMSDILVDDYGFIFVSHLQMSLVSKKNVKGLTPMPSDYYEFSKNLVIE